MNRKQRRMLKREQKAYVHEKYTNDLRELSPDDYPKHHPKPPMRCWASRKYLVQLYDETQKEAGMYRLSINRSTITTTKQWSDKITWDELMSIKSEIGFGYWWAFEVYPAESSVVNVANMRHLWMFEHIPLNIRF